MCQSGDEFVAAVGAGFAEQGFEVVVDRVRRQVEVPCDLFDGRAGAQFAEGVALAGSDAVPGAERRRYEVSRRALEDQGDISGGVSI
ncbi:hypothetical protein [Streptomyces sp. NPDC051364]|uniref:hypothetical protein n=1 Tax=Streptomyces sp. NPDC051364 TaxID=3155799 RepID=UPI00341AC321